MMVASLNYQSLSFVSPLILFKINGNYDTQIHYIDDCVKKGFIRVAVKDLFRVCDDPNDALDIIEYFA